MIPIPFRTTVLAMAVHGLLAGYASYGAGGDGSTAGQFGSLDAPSVISPDSPQVLSIAPAYPTLAAAPAQNPLPVDTVPLPLMLADVGAATAPGSTGDAAPASPAEDAAALAKKLANPVASLISVPFQFNYDEGYGPKDAYRLTLNVQPVIPLTLNEEWNLIIRTIVPVVYQDSLADGIDSKFGLGDTVQSFFFSPKAPTKDGWIWGVGPVFLWPTGTDEMLGSEKWGAGLTGLILKQEKGWTYGLLANHIWSYAGANDRDHVNTTFIQPFLVYTFPTATGIGINTESTYNWNDSQWTVPINLFVNQIVKFGKQPVQLAIGPRYYAESAEGGPEWGARFAMTYLFPK